MLSGALLGAGNIARNGHMPAYLATPALRERVQIVAMADPCPENRTAIQALLPQARTYADAGALFGAERPDFVDICAPPFAHGPLIQLAASAGCHVLCEKPLATTLDGALAARDAARRAKIVLFPCHQYHYAPQWLATRDALRSGAIGAVRAASLSVYRSGANLGNAAWQPGWRTDPELAGGGILVDHGTHLFYQLHALFGAPLSIACRVERRLSGSTTDDTTTVYLRYPRRLVRVHLTWAANRRYTAHRYAGSRGEVACLDDRVVVRAGGGERSLPFGEGMSAGSAHSGWFGPLLAAFTERIEANDIRTDRAEEAVIVAAYLTYAYESAARDAAPVRWREPLPLEVGDGVAAG
jgi:predicted dehydrogenase